MDKLPVGQLPDLASSNNDDEIMVITNSEYNQLKKEKISDLITDFTSTNENNALTKGTDGKMFVTDFGNASNITEGTLPVSVLPDIPKDKLPEIETDDLPDSGIIAGTYTYPTDIVINSKGQVTSITEGQAGANNANQDLSNLSLLGLDKINQSKALETGSVSSDADVYADILRRAHSTFDLSKFEVVGSPTISDEGVASGFSTSNYIECNKISFKNSFKIEGLKFTTGQISGIQDILDFIYSKITAGMPSIRINNGQLLVTYYSTVGPESIVIYDKLKANTKYNLSIEYINNQLIGTLIEDNNLPVLIAKSVNTMGDTTDKWFIGVRNNGNNITNLFYGSIDLKSIAIWADGVPVFNGNKTGTDTFGEIEIPYTLSKTGSKIVDVAYRDRVQDLYEQTGEALFYTLDEENQNFTLPASDIYGMIENRSIENVICTTPPPNIDYGIISYGDLTISDNILSNFSTTNYALANTPFSPESLTWEMNFLVTTGDDVTTRQEICSNDNNFVEVQVEKSHFSLEINRSNVTLGTYTVLPNTKYYVKLKYTGTQYILSYSLNGTSFTDDITMTSSVAYAGEPYIYLGKDFNNNSEPWLGTIDLSGCNIIVGENKIWEGILTSNDNVYPTIKHPAVIIDSFVNGYGGYDVYSNKKCVQWGYTTFNAGGTTVNYYKKFRDKKYNLITNIYTGATNTYGQTINVSNFTQSGFTAHGGNTSGTQNKDGWWQATGYIE